MKIHLGQKVGGGGLYTNSSVIINATVKAPPAMAQATNIRSCSIAPNDMRDL
jgi:hypothetical protein